MTILQMLTSPRFYIPMHTGYIQYIYTLYRVIFYDQVELYIMLYLRLDRVEL